MREEITPAMIKSVQNIIKKTCYDGNNMEFPINEFAGCSLSAVLFKDIIEMGLEHLARKASHSLIEYIQPEPKHTNTKYDVEGKVLSIENWPLKKYEPWIIYDFHKAAIIDA